MSMVESKDRMNGWMPTTHLTCPNLHSAGPGEWCCPHSRVFPLGLAQVRALLISLPTYRSNPNNSSLRISSRLFEIVSVDHEKQPPQWRGWEKCGSSMTRGACVKQWAILDLVPLFWNLPGGGCHVFLLVWGRENGNLIKQHFHLILSVSWPLLRSFNFLLSLLCPVPGCAVTCTSVNS